MRSLKDGGRQSIVRCIHNISRDPYEIRYVKNQTFDICMFALDFDKGVINCINDFDLRNELLHVLSRKSRDKYPVKYDDHWYDYYYFN